MKKNIPAQPIAEAFSRLVILGTSTGLGLGYLPKAPGTFGSLLGLPLGYILIQLDQSFGSFLVWVFCTALFFIFSYAAGRSSLHWGRMDDGRIVSDEVLGQALALFIYSLSPYPLSVRSLILLFIFFRLFDIWKPWPIRILDRVANGFGIILDDVVAGIYAALLTIFIYPLIS